MRRMLAQPDVSQSVGRIPYGMICNVDCVPLAYLFEMSPACTEERRYVEEIRCVFAHNLVSLYDNVASIILYTDRLEMRRVLLETPEYKKGPRWR